MFNVGSQLRKSRKHANLTLDQLAASSGVDRGTISRIELGHVSPRIDTIGFLCEAMHTNLTAFFGEQAEDAALEPEAQVAVLPSEMPLQETPPFESTFLPVEPPAGAPQDGYWPVPSGFWRGLLEVLERFEILVKNSHEMILVEDRNGSILYVSPRCEQFLGFRPQDLVGQKIQDFLHPDDLPAFQACVARLAEAPGSSRMLEYRLRQKDHAWCRLSTQFTNHLANPNIRAVVANSLKISTP